MTGVEAGAAPVRKRARGARYWLTLPERTLRALFAGVFGAAHETAELLLPRLVRRSRFYEVTAKNALRIAIELVGGVESKAATQGEPAAGRVAVKKGAGNVVEFGSIAAFGFSPLWLLAAASDVLKGSRVYLKALEDELSAAGILAEGAHFGSVDQLLGALEGASGTTAGMIDMPPLEIAELRRSIGELRENATSLPTPGEMGELFDGLVRTARLERRSLLEVSSGVGMAFLVSGKNVTRDHLVTPYREDWKPLRSEGFGAYAARISGPYRAAIGGHFDPERETWSERGIGWVRRKLRRE
jgi:hypothetical protein